MMFYPLSTPGLFIASPVWKKWSSVALFWIMAGRHVYIYGSLAQIYDVFMQTIYMNILKLIQVIQFFPKCYGASLFRL